MNGKLWLNSDILRTFVIYFVFSIPPIFAFPRLSGEFFCSDHKDTKNYPIDNQCIRFSLIIYDYPYLFPEIRGSRYNEYQAEKIRKTFLDNMDCFQMAAECEIGGLHYLFTHAGVNKMWLESHVDLFGQADLVTAETFNRLMFKEAFVEALGDVSSLRWGRDRVGSMVWADVEEFEWSGARLPNTIQVFGHTLQDNGPRVIDNSMYCLDCKRAFVLNASGEIEQI